MSAYWFCYVAVAFFGLCWAEGEGQVRPSACELIDPQNHGDPLDYHDRSSPKISRFFQNRTAIGISWTINAEEDEYIADLCGFTIHWLQDSSPKNTWDFEIKNPNETSHIFTDLQPGTKYQYYVTSYYVTQHEPKSWKLITFTAGCGPDIKSCDPRGSHGCNETTGSCNCKTTQTTGDQCETCPKGFYMHPLGCTSCDHCPNDNVTSTGSCKPAVDSGDTMNCDCIAPYTGKHCRECIQGFYSVDGVCNPCQCLPLHDEDEEGPEPTCDPLTGKCDCAKDRDGQKCEKCADGYFGNPLTNGCIHTRNAGVTALIVIVALIIATVVAVTAYLVCRRRIAESVRRGFFRAHLREDYDKVNFTTLEEEPEFEPGRVKPLA